MRISNDNVNFKFRVSLVNKNAFYERLKSLKSRPTYVSYPWTVETAKVGQNIWSDMLQDCIFILIKNRKKTHLLHIATRNERQAKEDKVNPYSINSIDEYIKNNIDFSDKNLHALVLGGLSSENGYHSNSAQFKQVTGLLTEEYKMPTSIIGPRKDLPNSLFGEYSLLYDSENDTCLITDSKTDTDYLYSYETLGGHEVEVTDDGIIYHEYEPNAEHKGLRVKKGILDYFKSRFEHVELCKFDRWA